MNDDFFEIEKNVEYENISEDEEEEHFKIIQIK